MALGAFIPISEKVDVGGHGFTVSALPCGVMRREVMPLVEGFDSANAMDAGVYATVLRLCHMSVSRADPSITPEALEDALMLAELPLLFQEVVRVSGLVRGAGPGEARGPRTPPASGATSTGTSQPPQAGHSPTSTAN